MSSNSVRRVIATAAVLGAAGAGFALAGAGTASAMPTNEACTASQFTTTLVPGEPGAGQRYAALQFTAAPGQSCQLDGVLPMSLTGAPGVSVVSDGTTGSPVLLTQGQPAYELLHWSAIDAPANQVTPAGVAVQAPATRAATVVPWNQGPVDDTASDDTVIASPVAAGTAPTE